MLIYISFNMVLKNLFAKIVIYFFLKAVIDKHAIKYILLKRLPTLR